MDNRIDPNTRTTTTSDHPRSRMRDRGSSGLIVGIVVALLIAGAIAWFAGLFDSRATTQATNTRTPPATTTTAPGTPAPAPAVTPAPAPNTTTAPRPAQ